MGDCFSERRKIVENLAAGVRRQNGGGNLASECTDNLGPAGAEFEAIYLNRGFVGGKVDAENSEIGFGVDGESEFGPLSFFEREGDGADLWRPVSPTDFCRASCW